MSTEFRVGDISAGFGKILNGAAVCGVSECALNKAIWGDEVNPSCALLTKQQSLRGAHFSNTYKGAL